MATRDYIKRDKGPARKKPTKGGKRKAAPKKRPFPTKFALLALFLIVSLGAGLVFLSKTPAPEPVANDTQSSAAQAAATQTTQTESAQSSKPTTESAIPPRPQEEWQYKDLLENRTVEIDTPDPSTQQVSTQTYIMQCGAYRSNAPAEERKLQIAFQGLSSEIRVSTNEKGTWYRVVLGPYASKRDAERDRNHLRRAEIEPCAIW
uniref:SPOR domain-containing protein n=1 Tax=Thaumasiovibrio occultus TaxID=1891184 RepID=UPI000B35450B|nr:SPOR domain-containing protein [Thaumasiovibrio occultus]